ncbi:MAG: hypothetical protein ACOYL8_01510 [Patescibacteria group bacterium]
MVVNNDPEATVDGLEYNDTAVHVYLAIKYPYVKTADTEVEALMKNDCLKHYFMKAVDITFPTLYNPREYGIYFYGKAKAELKSHKKDAVRLKIETSEFIGLPDMVTLEEMICAGTILPTISYEKRQVRRYKIFLAKLLKKVTK